MISKNQPGTGRKTAQPHRSGTLAAQLAQLIRMKAEENNKIIKILFIILMKPARRSDRGDTSLPGPPPSFTRPVCDNF